MTTEAWASIKVGVCSVSALVSGIGAVFVADVAQSTGPATNSLTSPSVLITGMIITALAPLMAIVITRLKTAAELKEIHVAVNSLASAKDAKMEALERRLEVQGGTLLRLTAERATQDQKLVESEKRPLPSPPSPPDTSSNTGAGAKSIVTEKIVANKIVTPEGDELLPKNQSGEKSL